MSIFTFEDELLQTMTLSTSKVLSSNLSLKAYIIKFYSLHIFCFKSKKTGS